MRLASARTCRAAGVRAGTHRPPLIEALEQNPHGLTVHQAVWTALLQLDLDRALVQLHRVRA
ncbi:MAG: hypothetical protein R2712_04655 [Vicinamibacterales bacterium]